MATPDMTGFALVPPQMDAEALAEMNAQIMRRNDENARRKTAEANRKAGRNRPKPGDVLFVTPARGLKARGRAGLRFTEAERTKVIVLKDGEDPKPGQVSTTIAGAEEILADDSLVVFASAADATEAAKLRAQLDERDLELEEMRKELARVRSEAHRNAPESEDGSPSRLKAAKEAEAKAKAKAAKDTGALEP